MHRRRDPALVFGLDIRDDRRDLAVLLLEDCERLGYLEHKNPLRALSSALRDKDRDQDKDPDKKKSPQLLRRWLTTDEIPKIPSLQALCRTTGRPLERYLAALHLIALPEQDRAGKPLTPARRALLGLFCGWSDDDIRDWVQAWGHVLRHWRRRGQA